MRYDYHMKTPHRSTHCRFRSAANYLSCLALLLAGLCLTIGSLSAGDPGAVKKETTKAVKPEQKKKSAPAETTVITGSLIPQKVTPTRIPITSSPVVIISRADIERSGETSLAGVLRKQALGR